jgi:N-acetyl sugar amidotransferase
MSNYEKINIAEKYDLPSEVHYCKTCVISNQRPRIVFDENGVCNACHFAEHKKTIDWEARDRELRDLCDQHRSKDGSYDCVIPSSGGKDSAYVAHQLKHEYGMHPLTITWAPLWYTDIGWKNLQNFNNSGFDIIMGMARGNVERRLCKHAMIEMGDPFQPFIYGQVLFPLRMALKFGIKLIFSGENAEAEYGGSPEAWDSKGHSMEDYDKYWFSKMPIEYWLEHGFTLEDLSLHMPPDADEVKDAGLERYFFGYFKNWTNHDNFYYAQENTGFTPNPDRTEGTFTRYSSIDDRIDGFHHWYGLLKFGIGRCTANAAREVREGFRTRDEAVQLVQRYDAEFPSKYFPDLLEFCDIDENEFWEIAERWRNTNLWEKDGNDWKLKQQVI